MFLFYTIVLFFGISYAILVSVVTILFKVNYRKHLTMRQLLTLIGTQFLMAMLAFCLAGTGYSVFSLIWQFRFYLFIFRLHSLISWDISQMPCALRFLQLRPVVGWQGLAIQMGALAYGLLVLTAALLLCFPGNKRGILLTLRKKG